MTFAIMILIALGVASLAASAVTAVAILLEVLSHEGRDD